MMDRNQSRVGYHYLSGCGIILNQLGHDRDQTMWGTGGRHRVKVGAPAVPPIRFWQSQELRCPNMDSHWCRVLIHVNPIFTEIALNLLTVGIGKHTLVKNKFTHLRNTTLLVVIVSTKPDLAGGRMSIMRSYGLRCTYRPSMSKLVIDRFRQPRHWHPSYHYLGFA